MTAQQPQAGRAPYPLQIQRDSAQQQVRIQWSDGHNGTYPFAYLRGWCPCAVCQGHSSGPKRYIHAENTDLVRVMLVGKYAISLVWGDGHDTGIYAYPYLRELCLCDTCSGRAASAQHS